MTNWSQEFDFVNEGDGGWVDFHENQTLCHFVPGQGWVSGYRTASNYDEQRIGIRRVFNTTASITQVEITYTGDFQDMSRHFPFLRGTLFLCGTEQTAEEIGNISNDEHTVQILNAAPHVCDRIDVSLLAEAGYGSSPQGSATISKIVLYGTGVNPFTFEGWQYEFDFANSDDGGWIDFQSNGTACQFMSGQGWVSGYRTAHSDRDYDEQRISIRKFLPFQTYIIQIGVTYTGDFEDMERHVPFLYGEMFRDGTQQAFEQIDNIENGQHTIYLLNTRSHVCDQIDLNLLSEAGYGTMAQGGATISKIVLYGIGANPFILADAFAAIRTALQANPSADISAAVATYKTAIQDAFGVTFARQTGTPQAPEDWGAISLHFAHQGLQKTAEAFEAWVETQLSDPCIPVDRYVLFRRIMGSMTFKNMAETRINVAQSGGHTIEIYQRPISIENMKECVHSQDNVETILAQVANDTDCPTGTTFSRQAYQRDSNQALVPSGRQAVMSPNNLIHELGHSLDAFAGFDINQTGGIRDAIDDVNMGGGIALHNGYSRSGMGPEYLQAQFYEHARVEDDNNDNVAEFDISALGNKDPSGFNPSGYLQYDLFLTRFDLWNSDYNIYRPINMNARIDTFAINPATNPIETVADSFLSWVRTAFEGAVGTNWQQFYADNIGIFLRNAAIWHAGMVQYYQSKHIIPTTSITPATRTPGSFSVRLTPAGDIMGNADELLPAVGENIIIFGWTDNSPITNAPYWLLVADNQNRLGWVAPGVANHNQADLDTSNKVDPEIVSPIRPFNEADLTLLLGG